MTGKSKADFCRVIIILIFFAATSTAFGQQPGPDKIPDGTQGEQLEILEADSLPKKWKDKHWRLFPGKITTFKFGGGFLYDFAAYKQDEAGKRQSDSSGYVLEPTFKVRDFRVTASGQFKTKRTISWKLGMMYDGISREWFVRESGIMINVPELHSNFFIGRTKEGFSLNKVMVGYAGWTMERQMALDVIPILADGVKWLGFEPKSRVLWNIGVYNDVFSEGEGFSTYEWQFASRIGWLPVMSADKKDIVHVGINYRYGETLNNEIRLKSRPEADPAPYFIDTGKFPAQYSNHVGGEMYYRSGPLMLGSEFYLHIFNSEETNNPVFRGGDIVVSYLITGETRPYNTSTGIFGFTPINRPVFKGGPGAWEAIFRFSTLDLTSGTVKGGKFWRITPMVNWYLNKDIRLELAYGYGILDRFELKGATHFFQTRIQFTLL
ncbi:MAG TPA: porin [Cyclobacteriaceae bacterium]|nr:porin [Cyclobacteriaceae bacterium]